MERTRTELEALYRERHAQFARMAIALVGGDVEEAGDVVQEAFARAYANAHAFRGDGPLAGWVWRILLHTASRSRAGTRSATAAPPGVPALPQAESDTALADALQALSPRQRTMVFLRFYADLSYDEIAVALGVRPGTVGATLHQSTALLRRRLAGSEVAR